MTIAKLRGIVDELDQHNVVVDVGGVGYGLLISAITSSHLRQSEACVLWVEPILKQEQTLLCGFASDIERQFFRLIVSVQGAGAKLAMALLSCWEVGVIASLIQKEDVKSLSEADGVGKKLASRLVLELKAKVLPFMSSVSVETVEQLNQGVNLGHEDALEGLIQLGYVRSQAVTAIQKVVEREGNVPEVADLVRMSLKELSS